MKMCCQMLTLRRPHNRSFHVVDKTTTVAKFTKMKNASEKVLFCVFSLFNMALSKVFVVVVVA